LFRYDLEQLAETIATKDDECRPLGHCRTPASDATRIEAGRTTQRATLKRRNPAGANLRGLEEMKKLENLV
jgi:hypothetical protein